MLGGEHNCGPQCPTLPELIGQQVLCRSKDSGLIPLWAPRLEHCDEAESVNPSDGASSSGLGGTGVWARGLSSSERESWG